MNRESISLSFQQGGSDKEYHAELIDGPDGWKVNFAYGRKGNALTTGTKTKDPVDYSVAKKAYDKLVKSKTSKGYTPDNVSGDTIEVASDKIDSGVLPQLLNELTEKEAQLLIINDNYIMQEKFDGRRKMIMRTDTVPVTGINKKGILLPLIPGLADAAVKLGKDFLVDGEDMGLYMMLFDDITYDSLPYIERYQNLLRKVVLARDPRMRVVTTAIGTEAKQKLYDELKTIRAEGVVFKDANAPYTPGRPASGGTQYKCKFYDTASCIVSHISSVKSSIGLDVFDEENVPVNVGNATLYANSPTVKVGDIVEIKYLYYNEGGSLYQPVLKEVRDDVDAGECTLAKLKRKKDV